MLYFYIAVGYQLGWGDLCSFTDETMVKYFFFFEKRIVIPVLCTDVDVFGNLTVQKNIHYYTFSTTRSIQTLNV